MAVHKQEMLTATVQPTANGVASQPTSIKCPSASCPSNAEGEPGDRDVVYLRYDDTSMRYLYICGACGVMWKTSDRQ